MTEIWVTPRACSECFRYHDEDDDTGEWSCDCWCHDDEDWFEEDGWDLG